MSFMKLRLFTSINRVQFCLKSNVSKTKYNEKKTFSQTSDFKFQQKILNFNGFCVNRSWPKTDLEMNF